METKKVATLIGLADACELQACLWRFPDRELAVGLAGGTVGADALSCLTDAGASADVLQAVEKALFDIKIDASAEVGELRAAHSRLFFAPAGRPAVYTSEGPFLFAASGAAGLPPLFATASVHSVEACMRQAGVAPRDAQSEPADSIVNEFSFLSYLLGCWARAVGKATDDEAATWEGRARSFWHDHASRWLPQFMEQAGATGTRLCPASPYPAFALIGGHVIAALDALLG